MPSRWDKLLDQKPIPILEHLIEEASKLLAQDLAHWPLPIAELDPELGKKFRPFFEPDAHRPDRAAFEESFRIARWELEREIESVSEYMRNQRWRERGLPDDAKQAILFISRWLVEQLLALSESTHGRVKRPLLLRVLEGAQRKSGLGHTALA